MLGELSFEQIETLNDKYKNILCPSMNINNGKYSCYIQEVKEVCEIK
jgi:hypothetical protein